MDKLLEVGDAKMPQVTNYLDASKPKPTSVDTTQAIAAWNTGLSFLQVFLPKDDSIPSTSPKQCQLEPLDAEPHFPPAMQHRAERLWSLGLSSKIAQTFSFHNPTKVQKL